jgi:fibro-slime domain-containing protein
MLVAGCGSRTQLLIPDVKCEVEGAARSCADACGSGQQTCEDGTWSECAVPVATRSCSDGCGTGEERCEAGEWRACEVPVQTRVCHSVCGEGKETCRSGTWGACDAPLPRPPKIAATLRDFSPVTHPDFEAAYMTGLDPGIVKDELGPDDKPVYAATLRTKSTSGAQNFDRWYRDEPSMPDEIPLKPSTELPGGFEYSNLSFFPLDGKLLGNEGRGHNYHFTLEAHTTFEYRGGEVFSFSGDDDMWVFINRRLAIDLGGLHQIASASVNLDEVAQSIGLTPGNVYPLHFFFAERHTISSTFTLRTTIADPGSCD